MMQFATFSPDTRQKSAGRRGWAATTLMVAGTLGVALASYSLSLKVSAERAETRKLARQNVALEQELKGLEAELRVRMRLPQLQRWNDEVLALKPITAQQYLGNPLHLAAYGVAPEAAAAPVFQLTARTDVAARGAASAAALTAAVLPRPAAGAVLPRHAAGAVLPRHAAGAVLPRHAAGAVLPRHAAGGSAALATVSQPAPAPAPGALDPMLIAAIDQMAARESQGAPADLLRQVDLPAAASPPGD